MGNASPLEIAWTLITLVALCAALQLIFQTIGDYRVRDGPVMGLMAKASIRRSAIYAVVQVIFAGIGIDAMLTPAPVREQVTIYAIVVSGGLIAVELLLTIAAWLDVHDRRHAIELIQNASQSKCTREGCEHDKR